MSSTPSAKIDPAQNSGRVLGRLTGIGAVLGIVGLGAAVAFGGGSAQFYFSWLVAYL